VIKHNFDQLNFGQVIISRKYFKIEFLKLQIFRIIIDI
jgi:hypothetical protein